MSWLARSFVVKVPRRAWCEMTAAAIASSRAMIDLHGLVLRLTRSTCVDRSICLPFCTVLILSRPVRAPNGIRQRAVLADHPGQRKALGSGCSPALMRDNGLADQRPPRGEPELPGGDAVRDAGRRGVPGGERGDQADVA